MRSVTYSMGVPLDGYDAGAGGGFDSTAPDEESFASSPTRYDRSASPAGTRATQDDAVLGDRRPGSIASGSWSASVATHLASRRLAAPGSSSPSGMPVTPGTVVALRRGGPVMPGTVSPVCDISSCSCH